MENSVNISTNSAVSYETITYGEHVSTLGESNDMPGMSIVRYVIPPTSAVGVLGNALVIAVMLRKSFRRSAMGIYLISLATTDTLNLLYNFPIFWGMLEGVADPFKHSVHSCRFLHYYIYVTNTMSSWTLVTITMERCTCVIRPFYAFEIFSRKRAVIGQVMTLLLIGVVNSQVLIYYGLIETHDGSCSCEKLPGYAESVYYKILVWSDLLLSTAIPFVIIIILNSVIMWRIGRQSRIQTSSKKKGGKSQRSLVTMLLATSFTFVVLSMPIMIQQVMPQTGHGDLLFEVGLLCININYAMNFYLYCLSGSRFRHELMLMFCPGRGNVRGGGSAAIGTSARRDDHNTTQVEESNKV